MPTAEHTPSFSDWSLTPAAPERIVAEIIARERPRIVELGSGPSSVILARAAGERGGRLVSVEHDAEWARRTQDLLDREDLGRFARVLHAPLAPLPPAVALPAAEDFDRPGEWYELEPVRAACAPGIDVLIVDGPPAGYAPGALVRAPALALADLLAPSAAVIIDDIGRPAERRATELWAELLDCEREIDERGRIAVLSRGSAPASRLE